MPIFRRFEIKQIKSIVRHFEILRFPKKTLIREEGEDSEEAFYVIKGALQTFINLKEQNHEINSSRPGFYRFFNGIY